MLRYAGPAVAGRLVKLEDLFHGDGAALQALQAVLNVCGGVHKAAQRDFAVFGLAETKGRIHPVGNVEKRTSLRKSQNAVMLVSCAGLSRAKARLQDVKGVRPGLHHPSKSAQRFFLISRMLIDEVD